APGRAARKVRCGYFISRYTSGFPGVRRACVPGVLFRKCSGGERACFLAAARGPPPSVARTAVPDQWSRTAVLSCDLPAYSFQANTLPGQSDDGDVVESLDGCIGHERQAGEIEERVGCRPEGFTRQQISRWSRVSSSGHEQRGDAALQAEQSAAPMCPAG